jgi:4-hydroxy-3-polyprenylbenzoate decarboxylase
MKRFVFALTGASGSIFGIRVLEELLKSAEVHLIISENTFPIIKDETGIDWEKESEEKIRAHFRTERLFYYSDSQMDAPVASGSFKTDGMLIVPCTMKTLAGIACGYANNLIERAADVTLKEARSLLLSPREMPFSAIHLENMLKLAKLGVRIAPPIPAFYHQPQKISDVVDFVAGKILDCFDVEHTLFKRWGS